MNTEPVALFPDDPAIVHWRQRQDPPIVTVRCARGKRRCDRLAFVYETDGPAVVVFHRHQASRPHTFGPEAVEALEHSSARFKKFDEEAGRALTAARKDEHGTAVILDDERWHDIVTVGCLHHLGFVRIDRHVLLQALRKARRTGHAEEIALHREPRTAL